MNDNLNNLIHKIDKAAHDMLTLLSGFEPVAMEWDTADDETLFITLHKNEFEKLTHLDSCKVIEHIEDRDGVEGLYYELQSHMTRLLTFRTNISQEEYEAIKKADDDIPF